MIGRASSRDAWLAAGLLALGCLAPGTVWAQRWHELYSAGIAALRNGQAERAVKLLRRAIEERPEPGVRVPTYGTNFEPRYFPYLRLAEAYLLLGAGEDAATVLQTSARLGVEPEEERTALESRVRALLDAKRPPPDPTPTPASSPPPVSIAVRPQPRPDPPTPTPSPVVLVPATPTPAPPPPVPSIAESKPQSVPARERPQIAPSPHPTLPALDITSDPPGAQVFLDDELVGRTDPETGRLKLGALAPGRHRLRLSAEGREDLMREVDLAGESLAVEALLPQRQAASPAASQTASWSRAALALRLVLGVVLLLLVIVLWMWKAARQPMESVTRAKTLSKAERGSDPGTDETFPMPFGDYSLVRRLGKGGMAVVYEAVRRGESFALKRPLAGFLDDERFRARFLREAELGRTLHHPNIIRIFDRGQVGDTPYFAMELVRGETLRARLDRDGRLDATQAARVTAQVAEALDYAHNKGVIHRDLKPSNIMLERSGSVKVMDYGIARAQRLDGLTTTGSFLGTPSYAAPETVEGAGRPSSDVYSLGVVFFEMLTGSLPFRGESAFAILRSHCTTPPPLPSSLNYALSDMLDRLVLRLLSKEPSARPSAEELLNELADYLRAAE